MKKIIIVAVVIISIPLLIVVVWNLELLLYNPLKHNEKLIFDNYELFEKRKSKDFIIMSLHGEVCELYEYYVTTPHIIPQYPVWTNIFWNFGDNSNQYENTKQWTQGPADSTMKEIMQSLSGFGNDKFVNECMKVLDSDNIDYCYAVYSATSCHGFIYVHTVKKLYYIRINF